ncbi:MAG: hypothetical protein AB8F94_29250 [Saprospiraceae bacterium]
MKKYALLLVGLIFPLFLSAQNWAVDLGKPYQKVYKKGLSLHESTNFLGLNNHYYFLNYKTKKENEILQFDLKHNLVNAISIGKTPEGKKLKAEKVLKTKSGFFLISSFFKKRKKEGFLYATRINNDGSMEEAKEPLFSYFTHDNNNSYWTVFAGIQNNDTYGFSSSPDSSKIVFTRVKGSHDSKRSEGSEIYQVFVFDQYLNKVWEKDIVLPNVDEKIQVKQFGVTNSGEVFLLAKNKGSRIGGKFWIPKKDLIILRVNKDGKYAMNTLRLKKSFPISAAMFSENDDLYVAGIYTNGEKKMKGADGTFMMKFDEEDELIFSEKYPYENEIRKYLISHYPKSAMNNFFNFEVDDLLINFENGYFLIVSENRYEANSDDIIVSRFSFEGELEWNCHRNKSFYGTKGSYGLSHRNGNIYLIYNTTKTTDEKKQIKHDVRSNIGSFYTDVIRINNKGEIDFEETIFHSRELINPVIPVFTRRISNGNMLLFFVNNYVMQFGTLRFR